MKLLDYYKNRGAVCDINKDKELKQDIADLLSSAVKIHTMSVEARPHYIYSLNDKIIGFAYYLLDYQGVYDEFFKQPHVISTFRLFTGMVFLNQIPFADAEHRLLEISQQFQFAAQQPDKENIAKFILCNFTHYTKKELRNICYRIEALPLAEMLKRPSVNLLYGLAHRKISWWKSKL